MEDLLKEGAEYQNCKKKGPSRYSPKRADFDINWLSEKGAGVQISPNLDLSML